MIRREVVQEKVVHVAGGRKYRLRRGDLVALFPLLSPQMDPEIHHQPQVAAGLPVPFPTGCGGWRVLSRQSTSHQSTCQR